MCTFVSTSEFHFTLWTIKYIILRCFALFESKTLPNIINNEISFHCMRKQQMIMTESFMVLQKPRWKAHKNLKTIRSLTDILEWLFPLYSVFVTLGYVGARFCCAVLVTIVCWFGLHLFYKWSISIQSSERWLLQLPTSFRGILW